MREPKMATTGRHACDNCGKISTADKLKDVQDLYQRVDEGEPMPSGECPACGCLCYPVKKAAKPQLYLVHNQGAVSLNIVDGPFTSSTALERAMIRFAASDNYDMEEDTLHTLTLTDGKPSLSDFCGGYCENIRWAADGCPPAEKPDTWDEAGFSLLTKKSIEKQMAI